MPSLSPTMESGTIGKWNFKEGDSIGPGDILADIVTDKATVGFEMQEDGVVAKLLYPEGTKDIPVGGLVAILVDDGSDVAAFKNATIADFKSESVPAAPKETVSSDHEPV